MASSFNPTKHMSKPLLHSDSLHWPFSSHPSNRTPYIPSSTILSSSRCSLCKRALRQQSRVRARRTSALLTLRRRPPTRLRTKTGQAARLEEIRVRESAAALLIQCLARQRQVRRNHNISRCRYIDLKLRTVAAHPPARPAGSWCPREQAGVWKKRE